MKILKQEGLKWKQTQILGAKSILQSWQNNEQSSSNSGSNIKKNGIIGNE